MVLLINHKQNAANFGGTHKKDSQAVIIVRFTARPMSFLKSPNAVSRSRPRFTSKRLSCATSVLLQRERCRTSRFAASESLMVVGYSESVDDIARIAINCR